MILAIVFSLYVIILSTFYTHLFLTHGRLVGKYAEGIVTGNGTARLGKGVAWSNEVARVTRSHFPALEAGAQPCSATQTPRCVRIKRLEYWLEPATTEQIVPRCDTAECLAPVALTFSAAGGIPFKSTGKRLVMAPLNCSRTTHRAVGLKVVVNSGARRTLWYRQVFVRLTYDARAPTPASDEPGR